MKKPLVQVERQRSQLEEGGVGDEPPANSEIVQEVEP
jgi:hypothetical protein